MVRLQRIESPSKEKVTAEENLRQGGSGRAPLVSMMQSADFRNGDDRSGVWRLDRSVLRAIFLQRQVRPAPMIVTNEALDVSV